MDGGLEMEAKLCTCKASCMSFFPTIIIRHNIYTSHTEYYKRTAKATTKKNGIEQGILRHRALRLFSVCLFFLLFFTPNRSRMEVREKERKYRTICTTCMFTYLPFIVCKKRHFRKERGKRKIYVA